MIILLNIFIGITYVFFFQNSIKKKKNYHYIFASIVSLISIILNLFNMENIFISNILKFINGGYIALALFSIVMFTGALNKNSKIKKSLISIRTQLSIIASLYLLPHIFTLYDYCLNDLLNFNVSGIVTFIIFLLFIVLFITSLKLFKVKLKRGRWKAVQRLAYPFFFLTYLHLVSVRANYIALNGIKELPELIIYSIIFFTYFFLRIRKTIKEENKRFFYFIQIAIIIIFIIIPIKTTVQNLPSINIDNELQNNNSNYNNDETFILDKTEYSSNESFQNSTIEETEIIANENTTDLISQEAKSTEEEVESTIIFEENKIYKDGVYVDQARGYRDYIAMEVTIKNDKITDLQVDYQREDVQFFNRAYYPIVEEILETQSTDVDAVSRATYSSEGIINAVKNALEQAKIK